MKILVLYNIARELNVGVDSDIICEQEIEIIVPLVKELLVARGYQVETLETTKNLWNDLVTRLGTFDLVLNMAESFGGGNTDEPLVPAMLEALRIPFTGASSLNMQLTLDKEKSKLVCQGYGVPVTPYQRFDTPDEPLSPNISFPAIVKPIRQEGSIGIYSDCVVANESEMRVKVAHIIAIYFQPVIVETFIVGREISVGVIGNESQITVFSPLEFLFPDTRDDLRKIRSFEYKWGGQTETMIKADLPKSTVEKLVAYTKTAFRATECRDYARMDFRVTDDGDIYLLEVNYNPGIGPNSHGLNNTLTKMASFTGRGFDDLIEEIILIAASREKIL